MIIEECAVCILSLWGRLYCCSRAPSCASCCMIGLRWKGLL